LDDQDKTAAATDEASEDQPVDKPTDSPADEPSAKAAVTGNADRFGRKLYSATCANCGKAAEVPFQPSAGRPVYCQDCYRTQKPKRDFGQRR